PAGLLALAQAFSVAERQLHGLLLNMRRVVSRIYGALFRGSLAIDYDPKGRKVDHRAGEAHALELD
ncbi:hypothetical protein C7T87_24035, partial [Xanthomonas hortorum pv. hederae]